MAAEAGRAGSVAIAIEMPRGAIVECLVESGFHVYSVNPKQLDRFRDRHSIAGAKDDRRDAFVLADSLRTDVQCFRRVRTEDPLIIQIRELSRCEGELSTDATALQNRLRDQVGRFMPQLLSLCPAANKPWLWEVLTIAPTPARAARLRRPRIERLLRRHRVRSVTPDALVEALRMPALPVAPGTVEAATQQMSLLVPRIELVHRQLQEVALRIEELLQQLDAQEQTAGIRDVQVLRSLPGVGRIVAATMVAEASHILQARDYAALRAHSGAAPVTRQSGKSLQVGMRKSCNGRLRNALYHWARVAAQHDAGSYSHYTTLRQRGYTHGRSLRSVADRLLRILTAMLKTGTLYDAERSKARTAVAA